mgnify:CR=1 FL=1
MSLDLSMDKVLARRAEVEERLSQAAEMAPAEMTALSRELAELRPVCDQVALVRRLVSEREAAVMLLGETGDDAEMAEMAQLPSVLLLPCPSCALLGWFGVDFKIFFWICWVLYSPFWGQEGF